MRSLKGLALVLPLTLCGCLLTTKQLNIEYDLGAVDGSKGLFVQQVDLNSIQTYVDHKSDIDKVIDLAVLGEVTNNLSAGSKSPSLLGGGDPTLHLEAWMTTTPTNYGSDSQVRANAIKIWGPLVVAPGATQVIDWDTSAGLITQLGKGFLLQEIKGDGEFTIYLLGTAGFYDFTIDNATLVLTLEAGL